MSLVNSKGFQVPIIAVAICLLFLSINAEAAVYLGLSYEGVEACEAKAKAKGYTTWSYIGPYVIGSRFIFRCYGLSKTSHTPISQWYLVWPKHSVDLKECQDTIEDEAYYAECLPHKYEKKLYCLATPIEKIKISRVKCVSRIFGPVPPPNW